MYIMRLNYEFIVIPWLFFQNKLSIMIIYLNVILDNLDICEYNNLFALEKVNLWNMYAWFNDFFK